MSFSAIDEDPPNDPGHPAALEAIGFSSSGDHINGVAYVPPGAGPHPAVLVMHGIPGYERNFDLAQVFRRAGWVAAIFHYRGAWGSGGAFSFTHVLEDSAAALDHLRSDAMVESCRIDPARIALVGASMGGWAALITAARADVLGAVSIAGFNVGAVGARAGADAGFLDELAKDLEDTMGPLVGTDARALAEEAVARSDSFDLCALGDALARCPLLLLAASNDRAAPMDVHHAPLVRALRQADAQHLTEVVLDTDHAFSGQRVALARTTLDWLEKLT